MPALGDQPCEGQPDRSGLSAKTVELRMDRTLFTPISNGKKESELRDSQGTMLVFLVIPECCQKFTLNTITATKFAKRQNSAE